MEYLQQAGELRLTKTHGRREVAYLNQAWEDVLSFDYALNHSTNRMIQLFQGLGCVLPEDAI